MKTYEETLKHIKVNKHQYSTTDVATTQQNLDRKLEVVAFSYNISFVDVVNDFADIIL